MSQVKRIISIALVSYTQTAPDGTTAETTLFVPIVDPAQVADLPNLDVVSRIVGNERLEAVDVAPYLDYVSKLEADIIAQAGATLTAEQLTEAQSEGYNTLLGTISEQFEAEAKAATEQPAIETPEEIASEAITEAAEAGSEVAQEVVEQVEGIAEQAGVSTEVAMQAIFGMKAAQNLAAKLVRSHVARQRADLEDLTAIADFLDESGSEVVAQLQASVAAKALPAEVTA